MRLLYPDFHCLHNISKIATFSNVFYFGKKMHRVARLTTILGMHVFSQKAVVPRETRQPNFVGFASAIRAIVKCISGTCSERVPSHGISHASHGISHAHPTPRTQPSVFRLTVHITLVITVAVGSPHYNRISTGPTITRKTNLPANDRKPSSTAA